MKTILVPLLTTLVDLLRTRASLHLEMLALRQQLAMVASRDNKRLRFQPRERVFWVWLYRLWPDCLRAVAIFKPDTDQAAKMMPLAFDAHIVCPEGACD